MTTTWTVLDPNLIGLNAKNSLDANFLFYWVQTFDLRKITDPGPTPQLNKKDLIPILMPLPKEMDEQQDIASVMSTVNRKLTFHQGKHGALTALFRTLLHQFMTAQLRVHNLDLNDPINPEEFIMKLRRLQIENFRGITGLDLELRDTTVLIGENNTGKTAVLDALRFALREVRSRRGCSFDAYDFHLPNATAEPASAPAISIRITFREDVPGDWGDQQLARLNRAKIAQIDDSGCACVILKVGARFDPQTQDFIQDWEFQNLDGSPLAGLFDTAMAVLQNEVQYYYLAALRDAAKHFDAKGVFWRPFLKESQLTPEKRAEIETKLSEVNQLIVSSHASFSQVVARLKEVKDVVSMTGGDDLVSG